MDLDQLDLNPRILAAVRKAKVVSVRQLLHFSGPDLQRVTGLSGADIRLLLQTAALHLRGTSVFTALHLYQQKDQFPAQHLRLSLGCPVLDRLLGGGLPLQGITELAGRSSAGKTQLALQLCLSVQFPLRYGGLEAGAVYVCTEDAFPSRRLQQLISQQQQLRTDVPAHVVGKIKFGDHIFIEHAADVDSLLQCVTKKVPVLLARGLVRLLVIDSVAAPFRCEFPGSDAAPRARLLRALGAALRRLSCTFQSPVLCINQVTEVVDEQDVARTAGPGDTRVMPALGGTWADQLLVRLMADRHRPDEGPRTAPGRTLRVLFAPHLPPGACGYDILTEGMLKPPDTGTAQAVVAEVTPACPRRTLLDQPATGCMHASPQHLICTLPAPPLCPCPLRVPPAAAPWVDCPAWEVASGSPPTCPREPLSGLEPASGLYVTHGDRHSRHTWRLVLLQPRHRS